MSDLNLEKRIPVLILMVVVILITLLDWVHGLGDWMMIPKNVVSAWESALAGDHSRETLITLSTTLTAAFLHGDSSHLVGNMLFLWLFGVVVHELCGWRWLVLAFIFTAIGGSIGQIFLDLQSPFPVLGASGSVMGLEGFYFGLAFQKTRPNCWVWPLARPVNSTELAAAGAIGVALDFMGVLGPAQGIAYGAHIGGFFSGILLSLIAHRFIR